MDDEIRAAKNAALEHEELVKNAGLRISNVDQLTPELIAALRGLNRGRDRFEEYKDRVDRAKNKE